MLLTKLMPLIVAVALGALAGMLRAFPSPAAAIQALNRYVLYFAFPILMFGSIATGEAAVPTGVAFYAVHAVMFAAMLVAVRVGAGLARAPHGSLGAVALCGLFGNVAYLGLPLTAQVLGPRSLGIASMSASFHMLLAMTVGPALLLRWGHRSDALGWRGTARLVLRQPLVWAPILGLLARTIAASTVARTWGALAVVGQSAAPVALFMLGLYLHDNRRAITAVGRDVLVAASAKLLVFPAVGALLCLALLRSSALSTDEARVVVLLAGTPTAITTFAIAHDLGTGERAVAKTIIVSTLLSLATLPALIALLPRIGR